MIVFSRVKESVTIRIPVGIGAGDCEIIETGCRPPYPHVVHAAFPDGHVDYVGLAIVNIAVSSTEIGQCGVIQRYSQGAIGEMRCESDRQRYVLLNGEAVHRPKGIDRVVSVLKILRGVVGTVKTALSIGDPRIEPRVINSKVIGPHCVRRSYDFDVINAALKYGIIN